MGVTTDIIVGFPGETEADFVETLEVMESSRYQNSYSFIFSPRPGTVAAEMEDQFIPREIALERLQRLQALQETLAQQALQGWIGKQVEVLIDGPTAADASLFQGRTSQNIVLNLSLPTPHLKAGAIVPVQVTGANRYTLIGEVIPPA
jgi:tRNA-2-methylthio-N6-dimethylallyladenosine synthase